MKWVSVLHTRALTLLGTAKRLVSLVWKRGQFAPGEAINNESFQLADPHSALEAWSYPLSPEPGTDELPAK